MNAATQALSNCPPLREYFRTYLPVVTKDKSIPPNFAVRRPISDAFQDLILRMWSDKRHDFIRPHIFLYASFTFILMPRFTVFFQRIKEHCAQFKGYAQQDSQEFIRCFLDLLHQELRHPVTHVAGEEDIKEDEKAPESRHSISSSCSSSQDELNAADADRFETADSGLSSDAGESTKNVKPAISASATKLPVVPERSKARLPQSPPKKRQTQYRSIINDIFDGELISTVKCMVSLFIQQVKIIVYIYLFFRHANICRIQRKHFK